VKRVIVPAPKGLVTQWVVEMEKREQVQPDLTPLIIVHVQG